MKKTSRIFLKILLIGLPLLLIISYGLIQTKPVKNWLAGIISEQLSTPKQQVKIINISGHIPWNINIQQVIISDEVDDLLVIDEAMINLRLLRLFKGEMVINSLKAQKIAWLKPFPKRTNKAPNQQLLSFPQLAIGKVAFPDIIISKGVAGAEELQLQLSINGNKNQMMNFKGQLLVKKGINTELLFNFAPNSRSSFLLDLALNEEAGGLVGSLLKLPPDKSINMQSLLKGDLQSLGGSFNLRLGEELLADLTITTDYANHLNIIGNGALPKFVQLPTFIENNKLLGDKNWNLNAAIKQDKDLWQIEAAKLQCGNASLDLTGEISNKQATLKPHISMVVNKQQYDAQGDIALDFNAQTLQADIVGELPNIAQLQAWIGKKANITWQLVSDGAFLNLNNKLKITAKNLTTPPELAHLKLGNEAIITAEIKQNKLQIEAQAGELQATAQANIKRRITVNVELQHNTLSSIKLDAIIKNNVIEQLNIIQALSKTAPNTILTAKNLVISDKLAGEIKFNSDDIASLSNWFGITQTSGAVALEADLSAQKLQMNATNINLPQYDAQLEKLDISAKNGAFALNSLGEYLGDKIALELAGNYAKNATTFASLVGEYGDHNFKLKSPANLTWNKKDWELKPSVIEIASATLQGATLNIQGKQTNNKLDITIALPNLPLRPLLQHNIPTMGEANLNASASITGEPNNPEIIFNANLIANEMNKLDKNNITPQQISLKLQGKYAKQALNAQANLVSGAEQLGSGKLNLPLELSLQPFSFKLSNKPFALTSHLEVAISRFNSWLSPLGHRIKANLLADLSATGDALNPITKANITLKDFNYTNLASGLCFRHGEMKAQITPSQQFILQSFKAYGDRDKGEITASGVADFASDIIGFKVQTSNAAIFCTPMVDSAISGNLQLAGKTKSLQLTGAMKLGKTAILIPSGGKTAIAKIAKIYRHDMARKTLMRNNQTSSAGQALPPKLPIAINLTIDAPNQIFVRGRGLDAEFGGNLHIINNINSPKIAPKIEGQLTSKRGRLALLGSTMQINEGVIRFMNGSPLKPYIQLSGSTKTNNTQINVELEGAVLRPKLALSSTPSLPQDEILALLLFGKPLQKISPFQALQLAQAAASLASGESGTGMLGSVREVLGVDSLNVGEGADGSPTIGAGKYVTDKVFVGIEQGTTPESRRISTEIELSPTVTGKTSTNSQGEPTIGLEWRYDY